MTEQESQKLDDNFTQSRCLYKTALLPHIEKGELGNNKFIIITDSYVCLSHVENALVIFSL